MRKFIVHTKGETISILEVEGEVVSGVEDPSVVWLLDGEFKFRILKPEFLYEPGKAKDKTLMPPIYCSHSVYWTANQAWVMAAKIIREQFEFAKRKTGAEFTEEQVVEKYKEIKEIFL